ncbi:hypothetical protein PROFUN_11112 [Planoprotostelium fungivorum]|uniref:Uncharacterized protein n=1 Tax=Planoprotostelium fungivorum TaxID=1890364 RepID=A0A2P6NAQ6_9EUKA|nr:hypothetical protein PROFUN_11112 [Planoprotostelium fungivorum]
MNFVRGFYVYMMVSYDASPEITSTTAAGPATGEKSCTRQYMMLLRQICKSNTYTYHLTLGTGHGEQIHLTPLTEEVVITTRSTTVRSSTYSSASTLGMGSAVIMALVSLLF